MATAKKKILFRPRSRATRPTETARPAAVRLNDPWGLSGEALVAEARDLARRRDARLHGDSAMDWLLG